MNEFWAILLTAVIVAATGTLTLIGVITITTYRQYTQYLKDRDRERKEHETHTPT